MKPILSDKFEGIQVELFVATELRKEEAEYPHQQLKV